MTVRTAQDSIQVSSAALSPDSYNSLQIIIFNALERTASFFGVQNDRMLEIMLENIIEVWGFMTIDDVLLCLSYGTKGRYGSSGHKFSGKVLTDWLLAYDLERVDYFRTLNERHKDKMNGGDSPRNSMQGVTSSSIKEIAKMYIVPKESS